VDVGVQTVDVNMQATTRDVRGYVAEGVNVTSAKTQAKENNLITVVNKEQPLSAIGNTTSLDRKSIKWEKIKVEPPVMAPTHDQRGNMLSDGVRTYTWNGHNQLARIQDAGFRSDYAYDGMGRKVHVTESQYVSGQWTVTSDRWYLYDGWNCVAELLNQSSTLPSFQLSKSYIWGLDLSGTLQGAGGVGGLLSATTHCSPLTTHWFAYDGNGNIVGTINCADGAISSRYEYDPFGRLVCKEGSYADENEYRFSTKRYNSSWGLYDYGYRHYSPDLGRWTSRDNISEQEINYYVFAENNPLSGIDVIGLYPWLLGHGKPIEPQKAVSEFTIGQAKGDHLLTRRLYQMKRAHEPPDMTWNESQRRTIIRLLSIQDRFGTGEGNRFVFTCKNGWLDIGHFLNAAVGSYTLGESITRALGRANETAQNLWDQVFESSSKWGPEDLSSNEEGINFGRKLKSIDPPYTDLGFRERSRYTTTFVMPARWYANIGKEFRKVLKHLNAVKWSNEKVGSKTVTEWIQSDGKEYAKDYAAGIQPMMHTPEAGIKFMEGRDAFKCLCKDDKPKKMQWSY
jgi:RHS repeat-associated protein